MAKPKIIDSLKLHIKAGEANPAPPIGSVLGQKGLKIMDFCKSFNEQTKSMEKGTLLAVEIFIHEGVKGKTFTFKINGPVTSRLLLKLANQASGSSTPNKTKVGKLTREQLEQVASVKIDSLNTDSLEAAMRILAGTARSMGIEVEGVI